MDALGFFLAPPIAALILCVALRVPWKLVLLLFLVVPLVAAFFWLSLVDDIGEPILSSRFIEVWTGFSVDAAALFGGIAPLLGGIAFALVRRFVPVRFGQLTMLIAGGIFGGIVGSFVLASLAGGLWSVSSAHDLSYLEAVGAVGFAAGATSGLLVAVFSKHKTRAAPRDVLEQNLA